MVKISLLRKNTQKFVATALIAALISCGLTGCMTRGATLAEQLDRQTGVTVTTIRTPLIFVRETPAQAAFARDVAQLAPIQVNRSGNHLLYLWVGSWSTMHAYGAAQHRDHFTSIVIFADGEPLPLELAGWTPAAIGTSTPPYLKPVAAATDAYYHISIEQLGLIAQARDIRLQTSGSPARQYDLWNTGKDATSELRNFVQQTGNP